MNTVYKGLVYANGDITLVLSGASSLSHDVTASGNIAGVYGNGTLLVKGGGSADIQVTVTGASQYGFAIYAAKNLTIAGGTLAIETNGNYIVHGLYSQGDILYTGGHTTITNAGNRGAWSIRTGEFSA